MLRIRVSGSQCLPRVPINTGSKKPPDQMSDDSTRASGEWQEGEPQAPVSSVTSLVVALVRTDSMPSFADDLVVYRSDVAIVSPLAAFSTK